MGGWLGDISRSAGSVGNEAGAASQINADRAQQAVQDRLKNLMSQLQIKQTQQELDPSSKVAMLEKALGRKLSDQEKQTVLGLPTVPKFTEVKTDAQGRQYGINSISGRYELIPADNGIQPIAPKQVAPKVLANENVPYAVQRVGSDGQVHIFQPGDSEWTDEDAKLLKGATGAHATGEKGKTDLQASREAAYASSYAKMRGQVQQYSVIDKTSGEPVMVNSNEINANPGKYMAGALGQQLKNRAGVFDEINYTKDQFNDALKNLKDSDFETLPRAQIALALKSRDPRSAMSEFIGSEVGSTLTPEQIDYITGLVSLQESALSLRSIAGMGQGSDMMRNAIGAMLPGPATPSKSYAQRQMALFTGELDALRKSVPSSTNLGMGGGNGAPPAGANVISLDDFLKK